MHRQKVRRSIGCRQIHRGSTLAREGGSPSWPTPCLSSTTGGECVRKSARPRDGRSRDVPPAERPLTSVRRPAHGRARVPRSGSDRHRSHPHLLLRRDERRGALHRQIASAASGTLTLASGGGEQHRRRRRDPPRSQPLLHHRPHLLDGLQHPELPRQRRHAGSHQHHVRLAGDHDLPGLQRPPAAPRPRWTTKHSGDANHLNTYDLVAGDYQLNWTCYADARHGLGRRRRRPTWSRSPATRRTPTTLHPGLHAHVEQRGGRLPAASRGLRHRLPGRGQEHRHHPSLGQLRPHRGPDHPGHGHEQQQRPGAASGRFPPERATSASPTTSSRAT